MTAFPKKKSYFLSLDDIVFEHRNRDYGCYYLRSTSNRRLWRSFVIVLITFLLVTFIVYFWKINPWNESLDKSDITNTERVQYDPDLIHIINQMSVVTQDKPIVLSEKLEAENKPDQVKRANYRIDIPVVETKVVIQPKVDTSSAKKLTDDLLQRHRNNLEKEKSNPMDSVSMILEKAPQFPGGYAAIQTYFYKNQRYPQYALSKGIHGSPLVSFVVSKEGQVVNAKIVKSIDPELDREAIRLVKLMPRWQPAYMRGKPIACILILPVDFTIK